MTAVRGENDLGGLHILMLSHNLKERNSDGLEYHVPPDSDLKSV